MLRDGSRAARRPVCARVRPALDPGPRARPAISPWSCRVGRLSSFNGEIYNYVELREELLARGWTFTSTGDSEVLLKGWLEWGEAVFARLNGMWAFAIYDAERDALVLSRDRFGEKPLFWTDGAAASRSPRRSSSFAGFPDVAVRLDPARATRYLQTGRPYDGASSWFDGIHQLEPGSTLWSIRPVAGRSRYW